MLAIGFLVGGHMVVLSTGLSIAASFLDGGICRIHLLTRSSVIVVACFEDVVNVFTPKSFRDDDCVALRKLVKLNNS